MKDNDTQIGRRSLFSMLGIAGVAGAAGAADLALKDIPDKVKELPTSIDSKKLYAIEFPQRLNVAARQSINSALERIAPECRFIILDGGARIVNPELSTPHSALPEIVDVFAVAQGDSDVQVYIDGVEAKYCTRAELFSDGRGVAYCNVKNSIGDWVYEPYDDYVLKKEKKIGRMEIVKKNVAS